MTSRVRAIGALVLPLTLGVAACDVALAGRAADEWTRSYPLADGGQLQITNTNGIVEIEGVAGSTVDVRAERVAHAATDSAARDLLSHLVIKEDVTPARISLESEPSSGSFGVVYEIHYHVRTPKNTVVRATTTNGRIILTSLSGKTTAATTNGGVNADALTGGLTAKSTNGAVNVEFAAIGREDVDLRTTNGAVRVTIPPDARANLDASVTNGGISISGLPFEPLDQSRRHVSGRINGGGTAITLSTTNGAIGIGVQ